ncbi:MAG TPA: VanW family protein [bacterium]|nr:VanW family protein [bacterium]
MKRWFYTIAWVLLLIFLLVFMPVDSVGSSVRIDRPGVSSPVKKLPWASNEEFLRTQREQDTPVLMAAYCVVFQSSSAGERANVRRAADSIAGTVIGPEETFSQNEIIGPYDENNGYKIGQSYVGSKITTTVGGGVCKIATALYNVAVVSNLEIVERYNHFMPVSYVPLGQDATVVYGSKDLKFKNNLDFPLLVWAEGRGERLYLALYGKRLPPGVRWRHKVLYKIPAPVVYEPNPNLPQGEERVLIAGMEGVAVETRVIITHFDGETQTKDLGTSQYWPMPQVIEINE